MAGKEGFWQPLQYERIPKYCVHCLRQGHDKTECKILHPDKGKRIEKKEVAASVTQIYKPALYKNPMEGSQVIQKSPALIVQTTTQNGPVLLPLAILSATTKEQVSEKVVDEAEIKSKSEVLNGDGVQTHRPVEVEVVGRKSPAERSTDKLDIEQMDDKEEMLQVSEKAEGLVAEHKKCADSEEETEEHICELGALALGTCPTARAPSLLETDESAERVHEQQCTTAHEQ